MRWLRPVSGLFNASAIAALAGALLLGDPETPLPAHWNPLRPLDIAAPVTPVTLWKLPRTQAGPACLAALRTGDLRFASLPDLEETDQCHIRDRVRLTGLAEIEIAPLETRCATALRLALWARHGLAPAAREFFGTGPARVHHLSSYNCRPVRRPSGTGTRMSTHATADAVDITGLTLADGRPIMLAEAWDQGLEGMFLSDAACTWFATALGPDYNSLHSDHFHLQSRGWGLCR